MTLREQPAAALDRADLAAMYGSLGCAVWVRDASGQLCYANPASARLLGLKKAGSFEKTADSQGWTLWDDQGNQLSRSQRPSLHALHTAEPERRRVIGIDAPGRAMKWLLVDSEPELDHEGRVQRVVSTAVDVTELKQAEVALRVTEQRYRRVLETTHEGLCVLDLDSTIRHVNGRLCEMLGFQPRELLGRRAAEMFGQGAGQAFAGRPAGERRELPLRRKDGSTIWAMVGAMPMLDDAGKPAGLLALFDDVTAQEQLHELALLRERERIAMDLHDGATQSLYGVALSLGALRRRRVDEADGAILKHAIDQLTATIHDMRDYIYQLRTGTAEDEDVPAALKAKARDVALQAGVKPHVSIQTDLRHLDADSAHHLLYIAQEALSNVARHARATDVAVRIVPWRSGMMLSIVDNGRGFDTHRRGRRRGDGLRNMQERAALLGATLTIDSQPGTGTTVKVQIP